MIFLLKRLSTHFTISVTAESVLLFLTFIAYDSYDLLYSKTSSSIRTSLKRLCGLSLEVIRQDLFIFFFLSFFFFFVKKKRTEGQVRSPVSSSIDVLIKHVTGTKASTNIFFSQSHTKDVCYDLRGKNYFYFYYYYLSDGC